jgi:shikimate O-hydroxycinnamoyltransferase
LPEPLYEPQALRELLPRLEMGMGQPLLAARLTQSPSGSVLGVTLAHAVADGYSFFTFLRSWSRTLLGRSVEPLPWARSPLGGEELAPSAALAPDDVWRRTGFSWCPPRRTLDTPQPASFGGRLVPPEPRSLSGGAPLFDNDLLCAWLIQMHADALAGPEGLSVVLPVDYRRSLGGLAQNYFGNAIRGAPLRLTRRELGGTISELAARIQEAARSVLDERGARDSIACLDRLGREQGPRVFEELHLVDPSEGLLVTNVSRLPFGMLDFGRGPPVSTWLPAVEERTAVIQQTDEGFELSALLPAARR